MRRASLGVWAIASFALACVPAEDGEEDTIEGVATGVGDETAFDPDACFMDDQCDPLAPECGGGEQCVSQGNDFRCQAPAVGAQQAGPDQPCEGALSCQPGLLCMPISTSSCTGSFGCCIPVCDLESPQCSAGDTCMALFTDPSPSCFDLVGVCIEG